MLCKKANFVFASLKRPWQLLFREPIVLLLSIYMSLVYGEMYMLFAAFPITFERTLVYPCIILAVAKRKKELT